MTTTNTPSASPASLLEQGSATFEQAFGAAPVGFVESVDAAAPGFGRLIVEMEFGEIYNRPGLDLKTRELCIIAACAALGATGLGAVRMHIPAAVRQGATRAEVREVLVQVAMAAGLPASLAALEVARDVFAADDAEGSAKN
jgi:4-carboxymuconolactone decarboxylase